MMEETAEFIQDVRDEKLISGLLDRLFNPLFSIYVFTTIFLPSGSIYGLNVKYPVYLLLLPLSLRRFFQRNSTNSAMLAMMLAIPATLSLWALEGVINGFGVNGVTRQYMDFLLTLLMCWLVYLFCEDREDGRLRFLRLVLNCELATCLLKTGMVVYAFARGVPVFSVVADVNTIFGSGLITLDAGAAFGRIQFASDALIPICLFVLLRYRHRLHIGLVRALVSIFLLLVSVIYGFSRYFWAYTAVAFVAGLLISKRDRLKAVLVPLLIAVVLAFLPLLTDLYQLRFSAEIAGSSDAVRVDQSKALQEFFLDAPLLGHGLGSYTPHIVRSEGSATGRYSYEMQLLALLGQTGIVGMTFFLVLLGWYYRRILMNGYLSAVDRVGLGTLLVIWIAAGLYNPLLEGAVASVTYATLATMSGLRDPVSV